MRMKKLVDAITMLVGDEVEFETNQGTKTMACRSDWESNPCASEIERKKKKKKRREQVGED